MFTKSCVAGALLSCAIAMAQLPKAAAAANATPTATKPMRFEVVSIRPNKSGRFGGPGPTDDGYTVRNYTPAILLSIAFGIGDYQRMLGLPDWCKTDAFDINAKVADSDISDWKKLRPMDLNDALRTLLEDRFRLKAHFEDRDAPAYALVVAKGGPRFLPATAGDPYSAGFHNTDGKPALGVRERYDPGSDHGNYIGQAASMQMLVGYLSTRPVLGRPVLDRTGLTGTYDFSMPILGAWGTNHDPDPSEESIVSVLQRSLGLKLEPTKAPVHFLIIDHIERPTEN